MYIDKYEIFSWSRKWNNGKQNKKAEITKSCYNEDHGMSGKKFLQLLSDLDDAWHEHKEKIVLFMLALKIQRKGNKW